MSKAMTKAVSIRAPRAGGDPHGRRSRRPRGRRFQSAPPVRGATTAPSRSDSRSTSFQSAPPVRGATYSAALWTLPAYEAVSIRAPRAGGDRAKRATAADSN